jgi:N-acetylglucosamine kinase-like BadF-type ATPase
LLHRCDGEVKTAIVCHIGDLVPAVAREKLQAAGGRVGLALGVLGKPKVAAVPSQRAKRPDLILGIDGGGTSTIAMLARADTGDIIGRAVTGPSNIQSVGVEPALKALDDAIDAAFQRTGLPRSTVAGSTLGLAGIDRQEGFDVIHGWAARVRLADRVSVSNDATLLLAAGTPEGWGLAVIGGTGSIAFVRTPAGEVGRCGGWGPTLGDEGSGYAIVSAALKAACRAYDRIDEPTVLVDRFVRKMNLSGAPDLIPAVYRGPWDRAALAGLAPVVLQAAADGDAVAEAVVRAEAAALAATASGAVSNSGLSPDGIPLALAGGVLLGSELYRGYFLEALRAAGVTSGPTKLVPDPALGAVVLARRLLEATRP